MSALTSVWEGNDTNFLKEAIPLYLGRDPDRIIDVTWGSGKWWKKLPWTVIGMDKYVEAPIRADYQAIPFPDNMADVIVFDPPHRSDGGPKSSHLLTNKFGSVGTSPEGLIPTLLPFCQEAMRVLCDGGIVLAKIADQVHWHRMVWHQVEMVNAARASGLTACDMVIKVRHHGIKSSMWKNQYHALKRHCFWIVLRKGKCEP